MSSNVNNSNSGDGGDRRRGRKKNNVRNVNVAKVDVPKGKNGKANSDRCCSSKAYARPTKPIGYKALEAAILTMDHSKLLIELSSNTFGFLTLLQQPTIQPGQMCLILSALVKVVNSPADGEARKMVLYFLGKILPRNESTHNFMAKALPIFVMHLQTYTNADHNERERYIQAVFDLLKFIQQVQLIMPQGSRDTFSVLVPSIQAQIEFINRKGNCFSSETMELLADVSNVTEKFNEKQQVGANVEFEIMNEPPEDFRSIQICPDADDILHNQEPFIRKNIVDGKYVGGVDHYLDVQFRLLREDFIRPLRNGIGDYLRLTQDKMNKQKVNRINDINIYNQVHIISSVISNGDLVYNARFDMTEYKRVRWQVKTMTNRMKRNIFLHFLFFVAVQQEVDDWLSYLLKL